MSNGGVFYGILLFFVASGVISNLLKSIIYKISNDKIKKKQFYLNNKKILDDELSNNYSLMLNLDKKIINKLIKIETDDKKIDVNNIVDFSLDELYTIKQILESNKIIGGGDIKLTEDVDDLTQKYDNEDNEKLHSIDEENKSFQKKKSKMKQ